MPQLATEQTLADIDSKTPSLVSGAIPVTEADGANAALGAKADAAITTSGSTGSVIAFIKGCVSWLASIAGLLVKGQATMANSLPVTMASNQGAIGSVTVTGTPNVSVTNTPSVTISGTPGVSPPFYTRSDTFGGVANGATLACPNGVKTFTIQEVNGTTAATYNVVLEGSLDGIVFSTLATMTNVALYVNAADKPCLFIRSRATAVAGGNVVVMILGMQ